MALGLGSSISGNSSSLLLGGVALTDSVHILWVLLDSLFLFKEHMAVVARNALCTALCSAPVVPLLDWEALLSDTHVLVTS